MLQKVMVNRAPVLTLWAAVVAERLGHDGDAALSLGRAVAGLNAQAKGRTLGIFGPPKATAAGQAPAKAGLGEEFWVALCDRDVPAKHTPDGLRAVVKDTPIEPDAVRRYLDSKFGADLAAVREAMQALAQAVPPADLAVRAYQLYELFRPAIPGGKRGWGAQGELDLDLIRSLGR